MSPQVLPLRLAGWPPRDAAGVAEAWEGTKALRACQTQCRSCEWGTQEEECAPLKWRLSEKRGNWTLQGRVNSFHAKTLKYIMMRNYRAWLFPCSKALVMWILLQIRKIHSGGSKNWISHLIPSYFWIFWWRHCGWLSWAYLLLLHASMPH